MVSFGRLHYLPVHFLEYVSVSLTQYSFLCECLFCAFGSDSLAGLSFSLLLHVFVTRITRILVDFHAT